MAGTIVADSWVNGNGTENYKCRAWVNFNGTGTVAIRASGNVSSITDNGAGNYTVNFASALADVNYATVLGSRESTDANENAYNARIARNGVHSTTGVQIVYGYYVSSNQYADAETITVAIFR